MKFNFIELTDKSDILGTYDIYKYCMFMPTTEKFNKKVDSFLSDSYVKIFACLINDKIKGIMVVSFLEQTQAEIIGIAVEEATRGIGIGSFMIREIVKKCSMNYLLAQTDKDAVGFYQKCRFGVTEFTELYNGKTVTRYKCELKI